MAAKHMKLLLAALALLLALAATFAHAHVDEVFDDEEAAGSSAEGQCKVDHCTECEDGKPDTCKQCNDKYNPSEDHKTCKEGVVAPARAAAAALAACVLAAAMLAL